MRVSASPLRLVHCGEVQTGPRLLRDSGHEVVALAPGTTASELAAIAVQEDVDVIAVEDPELGAAVVDRLGADVVVFSITSESGPS